MAQTLTRAPSVAQVTPSRVDPTPFTLDQELEVFGSWVGDPIWAPPTDSARPMAETMLRETGWFASPDERWEKVVEKHRDRFTQVREIDLRRASIRLPEGRFFVSVTEQKDFDTIEEQVPDCVQTRLDEFLAGPGARRGVRVWYLKPLCVEFCDDLILTTREDLMRAITKIREEVLAEYRGLAGLWRAREAAAAAVNTLLAAPRAVVGHVVRRRERAIAAYQAKLEFKRRKTALGAAKTYRKRRTTPCTFDDMYALTNPLKTEDVATQYDLEKQQSQAYKDRVALMAAEAAPALLALMAGTGVTLGTIIEISMMAAPPVALCDPAFVAEMPEAPGELLKIGHFDEVGGVTHVEI